LPYQEEILAAVTYCEVWLAA